MALPRRRGGRAASAPNANMTANAGSLPVPSYLLEEESDFQPAGLDSTDDSVQMQPAQRRQLNAQRSTVGGGIAFPDSTPSPSPRVQQHHGPRHQSFQNRPDSQNPVTQQQSFVSPTSSTATTPVRQQSSYPAAAAPTGDSELDLSSLDDDMFSTKGLFSSSRRTSKHNGVRPSSFDFDVDSLDFGQPHPTYAMPSTPTATSSAQSHPGQSTNPSIPTDDGLDDLDLPSSDSSAPVSHEDSATTPPAHQDEEDIPPIHNQEDYAVDLPQDDDHDDEINGEHPDLMSSEISDDDYEEDDDIDLDGIGDLSSISSPSAELYNGDTSHGSTEDFGLNDSFDTTPVDELTMPYDDSQTDSKTPGIQDIGLEDVDLNADVPADADFDDPDPGSGSIWDSVTDDMDAPATVWESDSSDGRWARDIEANYAIPPAEVHPADHSSEVYKTTSSTLDTPPYENNTLRDEDPDVIADENENEDKKDESNYDKPGIFDFVKSKISTFKDRVSAEIGSEDDEEDPQDSDSDDGDEEESPEKKRGRGLRKGKDPDKDNGDKPARRKPDMPPKPSGIKDILLFPFRVVMAVVRTLGMLARVIASLSGVFVILAIVWACFNVPVAHNLTLFNQGLVDEGTIKVSDTSYSNGKAVMELTNDSEMIAHVGGVAEVNTWSPSLSDLGSIVKPKIVASCPIPSMDIMPKTEKTVTAACNGDVHGVWPRVQVKVEYN